MEWILLTDKLPNEFEAVLIYNINGTEDCPVTTAMMDSNGKFYMLETRDYADTETITHWMPLPEPPKDLTK